MATELLYLNDFSIVECTSKVTAVENEGGKVCVFLDRTCFYPQGGGQPFDKGIISSGGAKFVVEEVRQSEQGVKHLGFFESGSFQVGENVACLVDKERRLLLSKLHTAGHVVDLAVDSLNLNWKSAKAFHFPEGPNVEYFGSIGSMDKEELRLKIENMSNEFLKKDFPVSLEFMSKEKVAKVCRFGNPNFPDLVAIRVVMFNNFGIPCGGTHVKSLGQIGKIVIRKVKQEKDTVKVSYLVE